MDERRNRVTACSRFLTLAFLKKIDVHTPAACPLGVGPESRSQGQLPSVLSDSDLYEGETAGEEVQI